MMTKSDFERMSGELIDLYETFLRNPEDKITHDKIVAYEKKYGGLQVYNEYLKSEPVPKVIEIALGGLSSLYQYGLWSDNHEAFSNDRIIREARSILGMLKKSTI